MGSDLEKAPRRFVIDVAGGSTRPAIIATLRVLAREELTAHSHGGQPRGHLPKIRRYGSSELTFTGMCIECLRYEHVLSHP